MAGGLMWRLVFCWPMSNPVLRDLYKSQLAIIHSARRAQDLTMTQTGAGMLTGNTGRI